MDIVWIEDKIAYVEKDLEDCLKKIGLDLDLNTDSELLTSMFWVSYFHDLSERNSPDYRESQFNSAQFLASKMYYMLPSALASTVQLPMATAVNSFNQARYYFVQRQLDVSLEWLMSATKTTGMLMGIIGAANSDELSAETHCAVRRDAAILGHAKNYETKAQAIELYLNGNWPSKDKAAEEIARKVNKAARTVRKWLIGV